MSRGRSIGRQRIYSMDAMSAMPPGAKLQALIAGPQTKLRPPGILRDPLNRWPEDRVHHHSRSADARGMGGAVFTERRSTGRGERCELSVAAPCSSYRAGRAQTSITVDVGQSTAIRPAPTRQRGSQQRHRPNIGLSTRRVNTCRADRVRDELAPRPLIRKIAVG